MTTTITLTEAGLNVGYLSTAPDDLDQCAADLRDLRAAIDALRSWEVVLTDFLADALGRNGIDVEGVGHVEIKRATDRKEWDRRELVRAVLDSRLAASPDGEAAPSDSGMAEVGGELISCSQDLARVLHVWNLGAPRVTALRERSIDPDEFATCTPGRISVMIT